MEDLGISGKSLQRMTFTQTEIPHGGIRDFRQKLTKNTPHTPPKLELLMEDLGISGKSLPRIPPL